MLAGVNPNDMMITRNRISHSSTERRILVDDVRRNTAVDQSRER
jgi:hypothetical protein